MLIVTQNEGGMHFTTTSGNRIHISTISNEFISEPGFSMFDLVPMDKLGFSNRFEDDAVHLIFDEMLRIPRNDSYEACIDVINAVNTVQNDMRVCLFAGNLTQTQFEIGIDSTQHYQHPFHCVLLSPECNALEKLNLIIQETGGSLHIWNLKQDKVNIICKDIFDRLLCVRTRGGNKLEFYSNDSMQPEFKHPYFQPNKRLPSFCPFNHYHFIIKFTKGITLNYFQIVYEDKFIRHGKAIPFKRIETVKLSYTKDTSKYIETYPKHLALSTAMQYPQNEMLQLLPNLARYFSPIQQSEMFIFLSKTIQLASQRIFWRMIKQ